MMRRHGEGGESGWEKTQSSPLFPTGFGKRRLPSRVTSVVALTGGEWTSGKERAEGAGASDGLDRWKERERREGDEENKEGEREKRERERERKESGLAISPKEVVVIATVVSDKHGRHWRAGVQEGFVRAMPGLNPGTVRYCSRPDHARHDPVCAGPCRPSAQTLLHLFKGLPETFQHLTLLDVLRILL